MRRRPRSDTDPRSAGQPRDSQSLGLARADARRGPPRLVRPVRSRERPSWMPRGSLRQLLQQIIDHHLLVLQEAFVPVYEQRGRTPFGVRRMTDVVGADPELDAQRLQVAEDPFVVLGNGREPGPERRELPGQPHTLPQAAPELLGRVVWYHGSARTHHRRCARIEADQAALRFGAWPYMQTGTK